MERETGFEPATSTLARSHSTTELFPLAQKRRSYHSPRRQTTCAPLPPEGGSHRIHEERKRGGYRIRCKLRLHPLGVEGVRVDDDFRPGPERVVDRHDIESAGA